MSEAIPDPEVRRKSVAIHAALIGHEPHIDHHPSPAPPPTVAERLRRDAKRVSDLAFDLLGGFRTLRGDATHRFEQAAARFTERRRQPNRRKAA
ncbi:MAG: hypothetical protein AAF656_08620 [Planctomycetota bacterium]